LGEKERKEFFEMRNVDEGDLDRKEGGLWDKIVKEREKIAGEGKMKQDKKFKI